MLLPRSALSALELRLGVPSRAFRVVTVEVDLDPLDLVRSGASAFGFAGFFASPEGRSIGGIGAARRFSSAGPGRLLAVDAPTRHLPAGATLLVGFGFGDDEPAGAEWSGFAPAAAVVPEVTVIREGGRSHLVVAVPPGSDGGGLLTLLSTLERPASLTDASEADEEVEARPAPADYVGLVDEAVGAIRVGSFAKVVLARSVVVRRTLPIDAFAVVARLRAAHPSSWVFGWQEGEAVFVGASPELLVARRGEHVHLSPLAGSAPRSADPEQDRRLGEALLASAKDRSEHELVITDAMHRLAPLVAGLHRSPTPQLHRFPSVQHLATPISGTTAARALELAAVLHPTAAVGGVPRAEAQRFIARAETIERGWYAGGIGWVDDTGDGEFAIALRCALLRGDTAVAYAGSGIVADSQPAAELEETRLKLRPMLDLLT
ncbi:MAG: isochorismate synthase [Acidimicrobiia bacterium]|nr:isochorismate synthase [Acidimicrobiia bacterium]